MRSQVALAIWILSAAAPLFAQSDPPGRVARLNQISGSVSFQPAGMDDWTQATLNRPLTTGDRLWTDTASRAELHAGSAALRLASHTAFQFLNLDDRNVQVKLTEGTLTVHLRRLDEDETFEVDTPNLAFALLRPGDYRIDAEPDDRTTVITVRQGQGEATATGQAFNVRPGEQARVIGDDQLTYDIGPSPAPDGWDRWCMDRTRREDQAASARYVSRDVIGYEDLDDYGTWSSAAGYGPVWIPRGVPVGWAPYRFGHWAWIEPWGWTWVDDAPWGFAPFHYGRWAYVTGSWAWVPGPVAVLSGPVVRPVYSPALVAWVGGAHWGISVSVGGGGPVGWVPLGPREVYVPAYHASPNYITRVNNTNTVINNVNVTNIYNTTNVTRVNYVNQSAPNAVTAMSAGAMATARPVNQVATTVTPQQLASAQVLSAAPVAPRREGLLGRSAAAGAVPAAQPPDRAFQREVVARSAPPPAPVPFSQRRAMLDQNPGRPLDSTSVQQLRNAAPAAQVRPAAVRVVTPQTSSPARSDAPSRGNAAGPLQNPPAGAAAPAVVPNQAPRSVPDSGWRRFGDRPDMQRPRPNAAPATRDAIPAPQQPANRPEPQVRPRPEPEPRARPEVDSRPRPQAEPQSRPAPVMRNESGERAPSRQQEKKTEPRERRNDRSDK